MKKIFLTIIFCFLVTTNWGFAESRLDFTLYKLESGQKGNTLLVIGGIQGDEPGGFNAASLLVTNYRIKKGNVWVVPNMNFHSIINRKRGVYGDMNRKFAFIKSNDPDYHSIKKIKKIITHEKVDLVINLHDGSGFYRPNYIDHLRNPRRWGQSVIIDQEDINTKQFGNLGAISRYVVKQVNRYLYDDEHAYHVKNTRTRMGNKEMAKTLTYFAINNGKPAFGSEGSKTFPTYKRAYYLLRVLEAYMDYMGIKYERDFPLTARGVYNVINSNLNILLYDNKIFLDIKNARNILNYMPLKINSDIAFKPSNPLIAIVNSGTIYQVFHGNRRMTRLVPEYLPYDWSTNGVLMKIDGHLKEVSFGEKIDITNDFLVVPQEEYRVNVIGFKKQGITNESGITIFRKDIGKQFSVDKTSRIFRVEVYHGEKFTGMILANFVQNPKIFSSSNLQKVSMLQKPSAEKIRPN